MSIEIKPSHIFPNGTSYEIFLDNFCYRCKHGEIGFAEYPENGGCKIWDAIEDARFEKSLFPCNDIVQIENETCIKYWHVCKSFETDDAELMAKYRELFEEGEG